MFSHSGDAPVSLHCFEHPAGFGKLGWRFLIKNSGFKANELKVMAI
jgi:hypothetical protein